MDTNRLKAKEWAVSTAQRINEKEKKVASRNAEKIPYTAQNGVFDDKTDQINWWTNGFWAGQLWLLYRAYGEERFRQIAENIEDKLDAVLMDADGMDHDSGFKWMPTSVENYKISGNKRSRNRAILAASDLAGRINLAGGFIRAWNDDGSGDRAGWAIIDCMMNLPLLYWASEETNDPRFKQIAVLHANTASKAFIRENGSVAHIAVFDPQSGKLLKTLGGQGMKEGSSWTRGQSWALYGFGLSYRYTGDKAYLDIARKVADYCISRIDESCIIPVDFDQAKNIPWEDSTAGSIIACGLLELDSHLPENEGRHYFDVALKLLKTLAEKRTNWSEDADEFLENCSAAYNDDKHNFPIIYGDYYFTEAVLRIAGKLDF
ncbi:MAG: glycoside hydrolase family 88 protein [Acetatifactor sp.]|nr:glycoside hydrolase family 88 protein [Acetatifactor sp.]